MDNVNNKKWVIGVGMFAFGIVCGALFSIYWFLTRPPATDRFLEETLTHIMDIHSYKHKVVTDTVVSNRKLIVEGVYYVNHSTKRYASFSTTTLIIPKGEPASGPHVFTLANISIKDSVYTKIDTKSELLKSTIPQSGVWNSFQKDKVSKRFKDISISGPVLDHLRLFEGEGKYLVLAKSNGDEQINGETLRHYTFTRSNSIEGAGGTLKTLLSRIGEHGVIDVWLDTERMEIKRMLIENGAYQTRAFFSEFNSIPAIEAPVDTSSTTTNMR